jgi:hypothetical protein
VKLCVVVHRRSAATTRTLPIVESLGASQGAGLNAGLQLAGGKKTQTTRYLKVACTCCDWTARVTAKHLEGRTLRCPDEDCEGALEQAA